MTPTMKLKMQIRLDDDNLSKLWTIHKEHKKRAIEISMSELANGAIRHGMNALCKALVIPEPKK